MPEAAGFNCSQVEFIGFGHYVSSISCEVHFSKTRIEKLKSDNVQYMTQEEWKLRQSKTNKLGLMINHLFFNCIYNDVTSLIRTTGSLPVHWVNLIQNRIQDSCWIPWSLWFWYTFKTQISAPGIVENQRWTNCTISLRCLQAERTLRLFNIDLHGSQSMQCLIRDMQTRFPKNSCCNFSWTEYFSKIKEYRNDETSVNTCSSVKHFQFGAVSKYKIFSMLTPSLFNICFGGWCLQPDFNFQITFRKFSGTFNVDEKFFWISALNFLCLKTQFCLQPSWKWPEPS